MLQAKWDGMKSALVDGNYEQALTYYLDSSKELYQEIFDQLTDELPAIASAMREIEMIYIDERTAKYRIKKQETIQGQNYDISYFIYFIKGSDGLWKIESF